MDLRRGFFIPEEGEHQFQGSWAPVTPTRPIPTRLQPVSATIQGNRNHPGSIDWLQSVGIPARFNEITTSNGTATRLNPEGSTDINTSIRIVGSYTQGYYTSATSGLSNMAYMNILGLANAASASETAMQRGHNEAAARSPFIIPISYSHIHSNQQQSNSAASTRAMQMQRTSSGEANNPYFSIHYSRISSSRQQSSPAPTESAALGETIRQHSDTDVIRLVNQNVPESSNTWTRNNCHPQTSQNGIIVPYRSSNYDLNSSHKTMLDAFSKGDISFSSVPVTPDNGKRVQNQILEMAKGHVDDQSKQEKGKQLEVSHTAANEDTEFRHDEPLSQLMESSPTAFVSPMKENQNSNKRHHEIDLNVTPQQKTRRRKHRPKVVIEGKPKRAPRPATPKQTSTKEKPKRKYVRKCVQKNGLNASNTPLADVVGETVDPTAVATVKSCKRTLNFNSEDQATGRNAGRALNCQEKPPYSSVDNFSCRRGLDFDPESQAQELCTRTNSSSETKSLQLTKGLEPPVENSPAGVGFDLNISLTEVPIDYISLPEKTAPATPPPRRIELAREDLKDLATNRNDTEAAGTFLKRGENGYSPMPQQILVEEIEDVAFRTKTALQSGLQPITKNSNDSNDRNHVILAELKQATGSKRAYCSTTTETQCHSMNLSGSHFNSLQVYQEIFQRNGYHKKSNDLGLHFPQIYKKKRTEKVHNTGMPSKTSSMTTMPDGVRRTMASRENGTNNEQSTPQFDNNDGTTNLNDGGRNSLYNRYFHPTATRDTSKTQSISAAIPSREKSLSGATLDKQKCSEFMLTFGQGEMITKKRSKVPTRVRNFASLTAIAECNQLPSTPYKTAPPPGDRQGIEIFHRPQGCIEALAEDSLAKMPKKKRTKKGPPLVNSVCLHKHEAAAHRQFLAKPRGPSEVSWHHMASLDDIVQKLNFLSITGGSNTIAAQEQTALVPFRGVGTMVPYEGLFDPTKKRRPRPKVDLDPETDRVWKLLMGTEDNEGVEETGVDKERWWEEERRVFRGRAESFIARMHLVQGDRRFLHWKGSVVDSVIGVFLTQNVSDHLSSSAFMSLAARFPLQSISNNNKHYKVETDVSIEKQEMGILDSDDTESHTKMSSEQVCDQGSITLHEAEHIEEREVANSNESFESNSEGDSSAKNLKEKELVVCNSGFDICCKLSENRIETPATGTGKASFVEDEDRRALEDVVSSQNSEESSIFQTAERIRSCSDSNSDADLITGCKSNSFDGTTFMELLHMASKTMLQEYNNPGSGSLSSGNSESECMESNKGKSSLNKKDCLKESFQSIYTSNSRIPFSNYHLHMSPYSRVPETEFLEVSGEESRFSLHSTASEIAEIKDMNCTSNRIGQIAEISSETTVERKMSLRAEATPTTDPCTSMSSHSGHPQISSRQEANFEKHPHSCNNLPRETTDTFLTESTSISELNILNGALAQRDSGMQQNHSNLPDFSRETLDVGESTCLEAKQKHIENKVVQPNLKEKVYSSERAASVTTTNTSKGKGKLRREKKTTFDWDSLRKVDPKCAKRERSSDTMDSLDWEAVRCADVNEIANAIKERGMNNMLAERIKDFLNRLVREHGSIDLEWLRDVPPDKVKEYLLSVRGLGLKSVECVRLLTLHHLAFPVDTNVGRIAVRLGWVPLQPLPESLQLHLLELYPMLESIQKYLWPRLCTLDQRTLYELHYQMITFGKVFCTKNKPNCNACPLRAECKHFASAFASARLALPGPEEKGMVTSTAPVAADWNPAVGISPLALPLPEANQLWETRSGTNQHEPIIEQPATPEPDCIEISERDMEDAFLEDPDEIPIIKLNIEDFTLNLQNYMQENNMELQEGDMSKALVALNPEAASIPMPKLKNVSRLRTEHQVYELPDSHPLLKELDRREPDDPCSYLLAIWTPGETAESIQPPEGCYASQESGKLCNNTTCFSCNSIREANSQTVRGTLLIPCKTAMRGSFPLNGTYFQVNEVFADHDSSLCPINVPRAWIWNLPRRTVFFGTSIPSIFKGLSTEVIQNCFWRGYVCVRGFDQKTRSPRPLRARLHFPASKLVKTRTRTSNVDS